MLSTPTIAELDREIAAYLPSLADAEAAFALSSPALDQAGALRRLAAGSPLTTARPLTPPAPSARTAINPPHAAFPAPRRAARLIAVASGKGGVGKTTVAVNLAIALAARGVRTALLDADFGTANADLLLGLSPSARLDHVFAADTPHWNDAAPRRLREIAIPAPGNFLLVPGAAGVARMSDLAPAQRAAILAAIADLDACADLVIADLGAGAGPDVTTFLAAADLALIITTPEPTAIADAYALIKCALSRHPDAPLARADRLALVVNQAADAAEAARVGDRIDAVCRRFLGVPCAKAAFIAHDPRVAEAVRARTPLLLRSPSAAPAKDIHTLAATLLTRLPGLVRTPAASPPPAHLPHGSPESTAPSALGRLVRGLLGTSRAASPAAR